MSRGPTAIILAGDRGAEDPVARHTGAPCKALSPVAGRALIWRAIDALASVADREQTLLVGPSAAIVNAHPGLARDLRSAGIRWIEPAPSPVLSASKALAVLAPDQPALITTADHALLRAAMIRPLFTDCQDVDLSVGMIAFDRVRTAYPDTRRTAIRLRPGAGYCGCNLFAVHTRRGRALVERWREVEARRKHPARVVAGMLGWTGVARYALRRLTLDEAFRQLSQRTGVNARAVLLDEPEAAIDVDTVDDLALVEAILAQRSS